MLRSVDPAARMPRRRDRSPRSAASASGSCSAFDDETCSSCIHLMIAGRLRWREPGRSPASAPKMRPGDVRVRRTARCSSPRPARRSARRCSSCAARRARALDPRRHRAARGDARRVSRRADAREPHAQARADRSAPVQRHRQRLLGRDPARRAAVAAQADALARPTTRSRGSTSATRGTLHAWIDRLRAEAGGGFRRR